MSNNARNHTTQSKNSLENNNNNQQLNTKISKISKDYRINSLLEKLAMIRIGYSFLKKFSISFLLFFTLNRLYKRSLTNGSWMLLVKSNVWQRLPP